MKYYFAVLLVFFVNIASAAQADLKSAAVAKVLALKKSDYEYGNDDAPIVVYEYFALTCPHCEYFYLSIFPKLKSKYIDTGKVKWIKRSYAIDSASQKGSLLLLCSGKDEYQKYLGVLLTKQSSWAYQKDPIPVLKNIASLGGMSAEKFNKCQEDKALIVELQKTADEAKKVLKIPGTPAFYINGQYTKLYTLNAFEEHFEKILKNK